MRGIGGVLVIKENIKFIKTKAMSGEELLV